MLYTSFWSRFELTTSVVIGTDCIGSCKSIYNTITARTAPPIILYHFYVLYIYRQYQLYTLCLVKSDILVLRKFYGKTFLHFSVQTTEVTIIVCRLNMKRHMKIYVKILLELRQVYILKETFFQYIAEVQIYLNSKCIHLGLFIFFYWMLILLLYKQSVILSNHFSSLLYLLLLLFFIC